MCFGGFAKLIVDVCGLESRTLHGATVVCIVGVTVVYVVRR